MGDEKIIFLDYVNIYYTRVTRRGGDTMGEWNENDIDYTDCVGCGTAY